MSDATDTARLVATVRETAADHQTVHSQDRARKELFIQCADALERLAAENAELRKNDARYRWLRRRMFVQRNGAVPDRYGLDEYLLSEGIDEGNDGRYIDKAIDAAMAEGKGDE